MNFLVTGANGQLGSEFSSFFEKNNVTYFKSTHSDSNPLDITDLNHLRNFVHNKTIDVIINCAAYNFVDKAEIDWNNAFNVNTIGPQNLSIVANEIGAILIHFSTDYVFDGKKNDPYRPSDKVNPLSKYALSKYQGEQMVQKTAIKYFIIRLSWVFGEGEKNFILNIINWSKGKKTLKIVTDEISSPTYTFDVVRATMDLLKTKKFGLYHFANSGNCSRFEWAKFILYKINWSGSLSEGSKKDFNLPAQRPEFSVLDCSDIYTILSFQVPDWKAATKIYLQSIGY